MKLDAAKNTIVDLSWDDWLRELYPKSVEHPFSDRHIEFWDWIEKIEKGKRPLPFVAIWGRGGAKSTSAELGAVRVGAKRVRKYIWYVSGTQDKADKHVEDIATKLESEKLSEYDSLLAQRAVGKYGHSKGWRRSRVRTASGLTIDALGLDVAARGAKVEDQRPDMIIMDDVDDLHDTIATTMKKINTITKTILPAGSNDCAVLFIQNMIHPESIASRLTDDRADFLLDRIVSGPYKAVENLAYEQRDGKFVITGGEATWAGQSLEICQSQMTTWGLSSFLQEAQHEVERKGGIWDHIEFQHIEWDDLPDIVRWSVWVDPAVTSTDQSDSMGICAGGIDARDKVYIGYGWEQITSPEDAIIRAIKKAIQLGSPTVGIETDQGGDTWESVYERSLDKVKEEISEAIYANSPHLGYHIGVNGLPEFERFPTFVSDKAGAGHGSKVERNQRMLVDYESGNVFHIIGTHSTVEKSLRRFPNKPLDLADAEYWVWNDLKNGGGIRLLW